MEFVLCGYGWSICILFDNMDKCYEKLGFLRWSSFVLFVKECFVCVYDEILGEDIII